MRKVIVTIEFTDEAWAAELEPVEDIDGSTYQPTEEEVVHYFAEYASGALIVEGVTYSAELVPLAALSVTANE